MEICLREIKRCRELWGDGLINGQVDYHHKSFTRFNKLDKRQHRIGDFLFANTLVACIVHLAHLWVEHEPRYDWIPGSIGNWMVLACAFLPALGAASAAIRSQGEVQQLAQRSKAMEESLSGLYALNSIKPGVAISISVLILRIPPYFIWIFFFLPKISCYILFNSKRRKKRIKVFHFL